jgi:hypothetical protein
VEKISDYVQSMMAIEEAMLLKLIRSIDLDEVLAWGRRPPFAASDPFKNRLQSPPKPRTKNENKGDGGN